MAALDLDSIDRHALLFVAGLAEAGQSVNLPVGPGADDIVACERAFAQRPTHMVADAGDRGEFTIYMDECDLGLAAGQLLERSTLQFAH